MTKVRELTEEDLALCSGGTGLLSSLCQTNIGVIIQFLYTKMQAYSGEDIAEFTQLILQIAGHFSTKSIEEVKSDLSTLRYKYYNIYIDIKVVIEEQELTQYLPE